MADDRVARTRTALERQLADYYREVSSAIRVAEQAGVDTTQLALGNLGAANAWHSLVGKAAADGKLDAMIDLVVSERPAGSGGTIRSLYEAYKDAKIAQNGDDSRSNRSTPRTMSDSYRNQDARIDELQKQVTRLETQMAFLIDQNKEIKAMLTQRGDPQTITGTQLLYLLAAILMASGLIFFTVYIGSNR